MSPGRHPLFLVGARRVFRGRRNMRTNRSPWIADAHRGILFAPPWVGGGVFLGFCFFLGLCVTMRSFPISAWNPTFCRDFSRIFPERSAKCRLQLPEATLFFHWDVFKRLGFGRHVLGRRAARGVDAHAWSEAGPDVVLRLSAAADGVYPVQRASVFLPKCWRNTVAPISWFFWFVLSAPRP